MVPSHVFPNTLSLMVLRLAGNPTTIPPYYHATIPIGNPITSVQPGAFSQLDQLTQLDLSDCRIDSLAPGAFLRWPT